MGVVECRLGLNQLVGEAGSTGGHIEPCLAGRYRCRRRLECIQRVFNGHVC